MHACIAIYSYQFSYQLRGILIPAMQQAMLSYMCMAVVLTNGYLYIVHITDCFILKI